MGNAVAVSTQHCLPIITKNYSIIRLPENVLEKKYILPTEEHTNAPTLPNQRRRWEVMYKPYQVPTPCQLLKMTIVSRRTSTRNTLYSVSTKPSGQRPECPVSNTMAANEDVLFIYSVFQHCVSFHLWMWELVWYFKSELANLCLIHCSVV